MNERPILSLKPALQEAALRSLEKKATGVSDVVGSPTVGDADFQAGSIPRLLNLTGSYDEQGSFRPDLGQRLNILEPRIKEVFWCRFTDSIFPEFGKERPVVVVSRKNKLGTFSVVAPITTCDDNADGPDALKLTSNPNPNSDADCWVLPTHLYTVSHWRLQRFRDKLDGRLVTPRVSQADFDRIIVAMLGNLPATNRID